MCPCSSHLCISRPSLCPPIYVHWNSHGMDSPLRVNFLASPYSRRTVLSAISLLLVRMKTVSPGSSSCLDIWSRLLLLTLNQLLLRLKNAGRCLPWCLILIWKTFLCWDCHLTGIVMLRAMMHFWTYLLSSLFVVYGSSGKGKEKKEARKTINLRLKAKAFFLLQIRMCLCKCVIIY